MFNRYFCFMGKSIFQNKVIQKIVELLEGERFLMILIGRQDLIWIFRLLCEFIDFFFDLSWNELLRYGYLRDRYRGR